MNTPAFYMRVLPPLGSNRSPQDPQPWTEVAEKLREIEK